MIFDYFLTVSEQVVVLFMLIAVGFICGKIGFMSKSTSKNITDIVLYFVTPCVIINAYQVDFDPEILVNLGITALCAIGVHLISIVIVTLVFRGKDINKNAVLRFGTVFSNCGFMSLPLQQAIIGQEGVLYGAAFVGVFNIFLWTYGVICMGGDKKGISAKSLLLNPGILGVVIALIFFLLSFRLPNVVAQPVKYLESIKTNLPMFIKGLYLSNIKISAGLRIKRLAVCTGKAYSYTCYLHYCNVSGGYQG